MEGDRMFKRKVYEELLTWKKEWDGKYACLLEVANCDFTRYKDTNLLK